jgi:hypothetical protein
MSGPRVRRSTLPCEMRGPRVSRARRILFALRARGTSHGGTGAVRDLPGGSTSPAVSSVPSGMVARPSGLSVRLARLRPSVRRLRRDDLIGAQKCPLKRGGVPLLGACRDIATTGRAKPAGRSGAACSTKGPASVTSPARGWRLGRAAGDAGRRAAPSGADEPRAGSGVVATGSERGHDSLGTGEEGGAFSMTHPTRLRGFLRETYSALKGLLASSLDRGRQASGQARATPPPPARRKAACATVAGWRTHPRPMSQVRHLQGVAPRQALRHGAGGVAEVADRPPPTRARPEAPLISPCPCGASPWPAWPETP